MARSLHLRSLPFIVAGYVFGPFAGLMVMWFAWIVPSEPWTHALSALPIVLLVGETICLLVEVALVTPLLLGFRRYRWRWLNTATAAALGFSVGYLIALLAGPIPLPGVSLWGPNNVAYVINGARTSAGWRWLAMYAAVPGLVGALTALVFRLIAVRASPDPMSEQTSVF